MAKLNTFPHIYQQNVYQSPITLLTYLRRAIHSSSAIFLREGLKCSYFMVVRVGPVDSLFFVNCR